MTRAELVQAFRDRFANLRKNFPELVDRMSGYSDERVIEGARRCGCCRQFHIGLRTMLELAERSATIEDFLPAFEELCQLRFPERCLRFLEAVEEAAQREHAEREPS